MYNSLILKMAGEKETFSECLTHLPLNKMATILQTTFQMHFLEGNCLNFCYNLIEICLQRSNWQHFCIGSGNDLSPVRHQAISWTNAAPVHRCIYVAPGGDALNQHTEHARNLEFFCSLLLVSFTDIFHSYLTGTGSTRNCRSVIY